MKIINKILLLNFFITSNLSFAMHRLFGNCALVFRRNYGAIHPYPLIFCRYSHNLTTQQPSIKDKEKHILSNLYPDDHLPAEEEIEKEMILQPRNQIQISPIPNSIIDVNFIKNNFSIYNSETNTQL